MISFNDAHDFDRSVISLHNLINNKLELRAEDAKKLAEKRKENEKEEDDKKKAEGEGEKGKKKEGDAKADK